jgi:type I restriction enzyme S subunit
METLRPKLRFPEFKDKWNIKKLKEIGSFLGGGTPSTKEKNFWNGDIPWISSSDVSDENIFEVRKTRFITIDAVNKSATKVIPKGNILIVSRVGVGKVAINDVDICTSQDFTNLILENSNNYFIAYLIKNETNKLLEFNQGTSIKGFVKSDLEDLSVKFPSILEQTRIANFLSSIDEKLNLLKEKKSLLEEYKKGIMQKLFSQEIRFKDDDGNDFEDWEEKSIRNILSIGSGRDYKHLNLGNVPVYGTGGLMTYVDSFLHQGETVCIGRKGTIDKPMYFNGDIWTVDTLFYTHTFVDSIPKYVFYVFQSINWKQHNEASGVPSLSKSTIEQISINVPSIPEQTKIADFLSAIDEKIELVSTQIEEIQEYKKGLLQQMFV